MGRWLPHSLAVRCQYSDIADCFMPLVSLAFLAKLALMMEGNPHDGNKAYALDRIISEDPAQLEYGILRHYSSLTRRWFARALAWLGIQ